MTTFWPVLTDLAVHRTRKAPRPRAPASRGRRLERQLAAGDLMAGVAASLLVAPAEPADSTMVLRALLPLLWLSLIRLTRTDARPPRARLTSHDVGRATVLLLPAMAVGAVATGVDIPVTSLLRVCLVAGGLSLAQRLTLHRLTRQRLVGAPSSPLRVLVAGRRHDVTRVLDELGRERDGRWSPVAVCLRTDGPWGGTELPIVSGFSHLITGAAEHAVDAIIVAPCRDFDPDSVRRLGWQLESTRTQLFVASGVVDVAAARASVRYAGEMPLLHVRQAELAGGRRVLKDVWERAAATLLLMLAGPMLLLLAVGIRLDSPGPAIFRQTRIGRDGRSFTMLKLRTMTTDSGGLDLLPGNDADGPLFKLRHDPRVTTLGRCLRRYSLDELPQLWCVLRGDMALVGPRPALPSEVATYSPDTRRRLAVRPGLTGLWQVSGRSDLSWSDSVRLDLHYVDNWSIAGDLAILARTAHAVIGHRGAY